MQVEISVSQSRLLNKLISTITNGGPLPSLDSLEVQSLRTVHRTLASRVDQVYSSSSTEIGFMKSGGKLYHNEHSQRWADCQLVTAMNAAIFLGLPTLSPHFDCKGYEAWVRYTKSLSDDTIDEDRIARLHRHLRIKPITVPCTIARIRQELKKGYPVEVSVQWGMQDSSHSILVVETDRGRVRVTNSSENVDGWLYWSRVSSLARIYGKNHNNGIPLARSFRPTDDIPAVRRLVRKI